MATLRERPKASGSSASAESIKSATTADKQTFKIKRKLSVFQIIGHVVRISAGAIYLLLSLLFLAIIVPFRIFDPIFARLGFTYPPHDIVSAYWARSLLAMFGFTIKVEGSDLLPKDNHPSIVMYSHASGLDPFIVMAYGPKSIKAIFKKSLLISAFYMFPLALLYGHIPIDRTNRESAIKSLEKAGKQMSKSKYRILISPEGTRSPTGELQPFKKGAFHLAKKAAVPIQPAVLFNNYFLWPPKQLLPLPGEVVLRLLPEIIPQPDDTVESLSEKVMQSMKEAFQHPPTTDPRIHLGCHYAILMHIVTWTFVYLVYNRIII